MNIIKVNGFVAFCFKKSGILGKLRDIELYFKRKQDPTTSETMV